VIFPACIALITLGNILENFILTSTLLQYFFPPTPLCTTSVSVQDQLDTITVTVEEVNALLFNLSTAKATASDGISARLLKECSSVLAPSLTALFNMSLSLGKVPTE
jgi:hypothetical protein